MGVFIVVNLRGVILARFDNEEDAHAFADDYGNKTGNFAYVDLD